MKQYSIEKIISGGQAGVDRAALDVAISLNIPHGGWCPKGRIAEDGIIPHLYQLRETSSSDYSERTIWNVRDSDGTLIITPGKPKGGTAFTIEVAKRLKKPCLVLDLSAEVKTERVADWIRENDIHTLNIAGPRASQNNDIYQLAYTALLSVLIHR